MVFIVVQWVNENSVSVVNEKKVVGENVELKEGSTVDVSAGISKGRIAIYKAEILKVCGTKAKALEFEANLVKKVADAHGDVNGAMEKRYGCTRAVVDNFIRGQQRKLRGQFLKKQS